MRINRREAMRTGDSRLEEIIAAGAQRPADDDGSVKIACRVGGICQAPCHRLIHDSQVRVFLRAGTYAGDKPTCVASSILVLSSTRQDEVNCSAYSRRQEGSHQQPTLPIQSNSAVGWEVRRSRPACRINQRAPILPRRQKKTVGGNEVPVERSVLMKNTSDARRLLC